MSLNGSLFLTINKDTLDQYFRLCAVTKIPLSFLKILFPPPAMFRLPFFCHLILALSKLKLACVAGVKRGRGRGNLDARGRSPTRSRAPKFPLPLPLLTPATQAKLKQVTFTWSPDVNISKTGVFSGKHSLVFPLVKKLAISSTTCHKENNNIYKYWFMIL